MEQEQTCLRGSYLAERPFMLSALPRILDGIPEFAST